MSFASLDFVVFFAVVVLVCLVLDRSRTPRPREIFLLLASYFFYGYWDWRFCFLLLFVTLSSWLTALHGGRKAVYLTGIIVPLAVLGFFKYFNFFADSIAALTGSHFDAWNIILPVGISFYTFQALSYVIDVHRGIIPVESSFFRLALYLSFFPQLVAGPIVRASDFLPQLSEQRRVTGVNLRIGVQIMLFGLLKKLVLADHLSVFVDDFYAAPETFHWLSAILAVVSYSLQIYLDFSGYSDIAIGCAKCLGYDFRPNFNLPFLSVSVTELWRRWHISLSTWLREYLYIPLGGNRRGRKRTLLNLFLTMLIGGLWHGASWTFVFWGGLNGLALCLERLKPPARNSVLSRGLGVLGTFAFFTFTFIFFRADSFEKAWRVLRVIVTLHDGVCQPFFWSFVAIAAVGFCSAAAVCRAKKQNLPAVEGFYLGLDLSEPLQLALFFIELGLLFGLTYTGAHPFVYFQF